MHGADDPVARITQHRFEGNQVFIPVVNDQKVDLFPHLDSQTLSNEISWSESTGLVT